MFHIDQDQPKVLYTAEDAGCVSLIDLRQQRVHKIFEHSKATYQRYAWSNIPPIIPQWGEPSSVKYLLQQHQWSYPHLLMGGKGYIVGLLDFRQSDMPITIHDLLLESIDVQSFSQTWSPFFGCDEDAVTQSRDLQNMHQSFRSAQPYHPLSYTLDSDRQTTNRWSEKYAMEAVTVSGMSLSKNGQRLLVNFQSDQIYTFSMNQSTSSSLHHGITAMIGGHLNVETFLKTVSFFGPNDDYIIAGSDSGHLWIWDSQPKSTILKEKRVVTTCLQNEKEISQESFGCGVVNVLTADLHTCNGAIPHPFLPLIVSYGIESDAKLWAPQILTIEIDNDPKESDRIVDLEKYENQEINLDLRFNIDLKAIQSYCKPGLNTPQSIYYTGKLSLPLSPISQALSLSKYSCMTLLPALLDEQLVRHLSS
jgi:WD40 repeat protein